MPVQLNVFDDIGINHLPMNSGVGSLNSLNKFCILYSVYKFVNTTKPRSTEFLWNNRYSTSVSVSECIENM